MNADDADQNPHHLRSSAFKNPTGPVAARHAYALNATVEILPFVEQTLMRRHDARLRSFVTCANNVKQLCARGVGDK